MDANRTTPTLLLDRYQVRGTLGSGGFGTVIQAFDTVLKRTVAIKSLNPGLSTTDPTQYRILEDRFRREAEAGARMGVHSNLVAVYDLVTSPDGVMYLILEYVPGGTLAERIRRGPMSPQDALQLTTEAARGLHAAHEHGIVHRDVKPANIFLTADGHAKVGDFGIAQIDDLSGRTSTTIGHPGTPLYMSPEQAQTTGYVRPSSDQYSLGLVLFEMLTGKTYKRLESHQADALLAQQPPAITRLIKRMMAVDSGTRYESMGAVLDAIESVLGTNGAVTPRRDVASATTLADGMATQPATPRMNLDPRPAVITVQALPASPRQYSRRVVLISAGALLLTGGAVGIAATAFRGKNVVIVPTTPPTTTAIQPRPTIATTTIRIAQPTVGVTPQPIAATTVSPAVANVAPTAASTATPAPGTLLRTLRGHTNQVVCVAFSRDGSMLATGSQDHTARLWRASDGMLLHTFSDFTEVVGRVAFTRDGQMLMTGSSDQAVKLWRISDATAIRAFTGSTFALSPDEGILATGTSDFRVNLWQVSDGKLIRTLVGHTWNIHNIAFSPDAQLIVATSADGTTRIWRVGDGTSVRTLSGQGGFTTGAAFTPDGSLLATGAQDGSVRLWRVNDGLSLRSLQAPDMRDVINVAIAPDGQSLATASLDGVGRLWRASDGMLLNSLVGHSAGLYDIAFSPDGRTIATASLDGTVRLWWIGAGR